MRIDNYIRYRKFLEGAVITAGKEIVRAKLNGKFILINYDDIKALTDKYMDGKLIKQASFKHENLTSYEMRILKACKVALNINHIFVYEKDIVSKIKNKDATIVSSVEYDPKVSKKRGLIE
jgi:hypothetical protein